MSGQPEPQAGYTICRYKERFWALYDPAGLLICVTLYKKGALEVLRRLAHA